MCCAAFFVHQNPKKTFKKCQTKKPIFPAMEIETLECYRPSINLSLAITDSSNFMTNAVPLCQCAVTFAGYKHQTRMTDDTSTTATEIISAKVPHDRLRDKVIWYWSRSMEVACLFGHNSQCSLCSCRRPGGRALATGRFLWPQREHGTLCRFPCEQFHLT